jgi:DNA-binding response OmpR family regulator
MKVLLAEDNVDLNRIISKWLKVQKLTVDSVFDGQEAWDYIQVSDYDLLILDVMMPKIDGFELIKRVREHHLNVPVLFLTAKDALEDRVQGLDLGADDYLVKPFEFDELLARVRALLRRSQRQVLTNQIKLNSLTLDLDKKQATLNEELIDLTSKEYQVLEYLARNRGQVLSREQIREHVWGIDYEGESNIIDVLIKNIRRKCDLPDTDSIIKTKRGLGYVIP